MSLRHGILGLLSKWEASGYDIKKEFDEYMSVFWHSHLSQIYPELAKLEKAGLVKSRLVPQEGKPDKKMYAITDEGKAELFEWMTKQPDSPKIKDPFLMQTYFMDNLSPEEAIYHLTYYRKEREKRLESMEKIVKEKMKSLKERNVFSGRILFAMAVMVRGMEEERQYISWCSRTIELVESSQFIWDDETTTHTYADAENLIRKYAGPDFLE